MNIPAPYVLFRFSSSQFDHSKKSVTHYFVPLVVKGCVFLEKIVEFEGRWWVQDEWCACVFVVHHGFVALGVILGFKN